MMKKILLTFSLIVAAFTASAQNGKVAILSVNDMHAQINQMPRFAFIADSLRAIYPDLLVLSAGDNRTGDPINDQYPEPSYPMMALMNHVGFNGSAIGNHEFDGGPKSLAYQIANSNFRYICANIEAPDSMHIWTTPFNFYNVGDVKVGVLGLVQRGVSGIPDCHPARVVGMKFNPEIDKVKEFAWMRNECNIFILLTHRGYEEDVDFTKDVAPYGVDAIIGGHSHTLVEIPTSHNGVLVTQAMWKLKYCTLTVFDVVDGKVAGYKCQTIAIDKKNPNIDPKAKAMVDQFNDNPAMKRVLTNVAAPFTEKEQLGCLMSDALKEGLDADIAFQNRGGVRFATKEVGPFTVRDMYNLDPFGNEAVIINLTGEQVKQLIAGCIAEDGYGAPCCAGIKYEVSYDRIVKSGEQKNVKINKITMEDGKKFDPKKTYKVATSTFVISTSLPKDSDQGTNTFTPCSDFLMKYLETHPNLDYTGVARVKENINLIQ